MPQIKHNYCHQTRHHCVCVTLGGVSKQKKCSPHINNTFDISFFIYIFGFHVDLTKICSGTKVFIVFAPYLFWKGCAHTDFTLPPSFPTLKPKTLLNQDSPSPTSANPRRSPCLLFLFISLSLFSCFLSVLWRQVAWRMPGLKQHTVVRVTLSTESVRCIMLLVLYNRDTWLFRFLQHPKYT